METSLRPKPRPKRRMTSSLRPKPRPDDLEEGATLQRAIRNSQPPKMAKGGKLKMVEKGGKKVPAFAADGVGKMAMGGKCRGMGAATKGGKYNKAG